MSAVTTTDPTAATPDADGQLLTEAAEDADVVVRAWTRTPEQELLVRNYLEMIDEQYAGADPRLVAMLKDTTTIGTAEMCEMLGYDDRKTRAFQLFGKTRRLAEADQVPHPSAVPEADAYGGKRGPRDIRGVIRGRMWHWMLQSCRFRWDPIAGKIVPQTGINAGGAPKQRKKG